MFVRVALLVIGCLAIADARPPKPKPPPSTGYLAIDSQPSAVIYVDDKKLGETPIARYALPAGRHVVRAVRDNGDTQRLNIDVYDGMTIEYRLTWDGRDDTAGYRDGYLTVFSTPPAQIWIDRVDTGKTTPVRALPLEPGRHKVMFVVGGDRYTFGINIDAGQTTIMTKSF
jgi:hypothetical protein